MRRVLFVSNGHGESAIAERIAQEAAALARAPLGLDHLALVGVPQAGGPLTMVGPRRSLPSGGLVAMGNVRAFARDLRAGFAGLFAQQVGFLRAEGSRYDAVVAVGDAYALSLARLAKRPTIFVGTAKSVYCAPYGRWERRLLRKASRTFVRDAATAERLRAQGVAAEAPGNVIADLTVTDGAAAPPAAIAILPGSREPAYAEALVLTRIVRALSGGVPATLSIAPGLDPERFASALASDGWSVERQSEGPVAFTARFGEHAVFGWQGPAGALFGSAAIALGQAGTANEQAAAAGLPVVALDDDGPPGGRRRRESWYRMRQRRLLGEALVLVRPDPDAGAAAVQALLDDAPRRARMGAVGRERMGPPGGTRAVALAVVEVVQA
ncbi:MAG: hypothetical protein GIW95_01705 [Candidatus Eremiobacteraeota bacterium]|nr:hypothetical protein [Candidatus Eremiobacteraeota bacterium]